MGVGAGVAAASGLPDGAGEAETAGLAAAFTMTVKLVVKPP